MTRGEERKRPWMFILKATAACGFPVYAGPFDIGQATLVVDQYLIPNGWTPEFLTLRTFDEAVRFYTAGNRPQPLPIADFHVTLRRAVYASPRYGGVEDLTAQAIVAHAEAHRPMQLWSGDLDCMFGECDHDQDPSGRCTGMTPHKLLCTTCSVMADAGSEMGPIWPEPGQVTWPCTPLTTIAGYFHVPVPQIGA